MAQSSARRPVGDLENFVLITIKSFLEQLNFEGLLLRRVSEHHALAAVLDQFPQALVRVSVAEAVLQPLMVIFHRLWRQTLHHKAEIGDPESLVW